MSICTWNEDYKAGQIAEQMFKQLLLIKGISGVTENNSESIEQLRKYDLLYYQTNSSKPIKIEVKADAKAMITNNFYIECRYNDSLSGIDTTESDYYAILFDSVFYIIKTKKLKKLCNSNDYQCIEANNTFGYLIPVNVIAEFSKQIKITDYI